jgi:predicted DsbA family dithiol-disulfide isomerase
MVHTDRLQAEYTIQIKWLAFPLHPEVPEEGMTLAEMFAGRNIDVASIQQRLQQVAASVGLPLAPQTRSYNTRAAQELAKWAESKGKGDEFHHGAFNAYFGKGSNIAKTGILLEIVDSLGLPVTEAQSVIAGRTYKDEVDADWGRSRMWGIRGVPTLICANRRLVGFQPYEALEGLVKEAGIEKKPV